jgi:hypothetical protein
LVEGHVAPTWIHLVHTISRFLPPIGKVHPPSKPMVRLNSHLTHKLEENSTFDTKRPFSFCMHVLRGPELPKDPEIFPRGSGLQAFHLTHDIASQNPGVPKSRPPKGSTLIRGDVLDAMSNTGGSQILLLPHGTNKLLSEMTRGPTR